MFLNILQGLNTIFSLFGKLLIRGVARYMLLVIAWIVIFLFAADKAAAQDAHYWTLQYGPKSSLLGGAVIGAALPFIRNLLPTLIRFFPLLQQLYQRKQSSQSIRGHGRHGNEGRRSRRTGNRHDHARRRPP